MDKQKKQSIVELIEIINKLDMSSIALLTSGANILKAKEVIDQKSEGKSPPDERRVG